MTPIICKDALKVPLYDNTIADEREISEEERERKKKIKRKRGGKEETRGSTMCQLVINCLLLIE